MRGDEFATTRAIIIMQQYYLFKGTDAFRHLEASVSENVITNSFSLIGPVFELKENSGLLLLFQDGKQIAHTSTITSKLSFAGIHSEAPVNRIEPKGVIAANEMVVYKTGRGSIYTFVPVYASLACIYGT